ncbi:hypothetical protein T492DRAFT_174132 [Pavlovales sp. CCMP2436]|nr:hypothetical protein T492DRAFT_174132 [Pavlovales sp. CCMP2436]
MFNPVAWLRSEATAASAGTLAEADKSSAAVLAEDQKQRLQRALAEGAVADSGGQPGAEAPLAPSRAGLGLEAAAGSGKAAAEEGCLLESDRGPTPAEIPAEISADLGLGAAAAGSAEAGSAGESAESAVPEGQLVREEQHGQAAGSESEAGTQVGTISPAAAAAAARVRSPGRRRALSPWWPSRRLLPRWAGGCPSSSPARRPTCPTRYCSCARCPTPCCRSRRS